MSRVVVWGKPEAPLKDDERRCTDADQEAAAVVFHVDARLFHGIVPVCEARGAVCPEGEA